MPELIRATYRTPFDIGPRKYCRIAPGATLEQIAQGMALPDEWWLPGRGLIAVDGQIVPRAMWGRVKPKSGVTEVQFLVALQGGGGERGRKNPLAVIASLALLAATGFVAGGGLATRFGLASFAKGTVGAQLAAGVIGLAGQALLGRLAGQPRIAQQEAEAAQAPNNAGVEGNAISRGSAIPRVWGERDLFPPLACQPLTWFEGNDEVTEAVYVLGGPHEMTDLRLGGAPIADLRGVQVEMLGGFPGQPRLGLVDRFAVTEDVGQELRGHALRDDGLAIDDQAEGGWQPQGYILGTRETPDAVWIGLVFPQGLSVNGSADTRLRVPFRIRMRRIGDASWINLPELHYSGVALRPIRLSVRLAFSAAPENSVGAPVGEGWVEARLTTPAQTAIPETSGWMANDSFDRGTGSAAFLTAFNFETTRVRRVQMTRDTATIHLDRAVFQPGFWEIEVTRGVAVRDADYASATYHTGGSVWDLFGARGQGTLQVAQSQKDRISTVGIVRASSVFNRHPVPHDKCAVIGLRVRNRTVGQLSVTARGLLRDGDNWVATSNPEPHFRDALRGAFNARPVPDALIDMADLDAWRADCDAKGYQVNGIFEGGSVRNVLSRLAAAGYAVPRMTNEWGVVRGRDTSAEAPVQIFSPRNARSISTSVTFPDMPDGLRVTFRDRARRYQEREIIVPDSARGGVLQAVDYADRVTEAEAVQQARFDLAEMRLRTAGISLTTGAENLAARRGDLIELARDTLDRQAGAARVVAWDTDTAGDVTAIQVDGLLPVVNEADVRAVANLRAVADVRQLGLRSGIVLRGGDGGPVRSVAALSNATGETDVLDLAAPLADSGIYVGALLAVGPMSQITERLIVSGIERRGAFDATITCVDEAAALFADH